MFFGYVSLLKTVVFDLLSCGSPMPTYLLFLWLNAGLINSCRVPLEFLISSSHFVVITKIKKHHSMFVVPSLRLLICYIYGDEVCVLYFRTVV